MAAVPVSALTFKPLINQAAARPAARLTTVAVCAANLTRPRSEDGRKEAIQCQQQSGETICMLSTRMVSLSFPCLHMNRRLRPQAYFQLNFYVSTHCNGFYIQYQQVLPMSEFVSTHKWHNGNQQLCLIFNICNPRSLHNTN